MLEYNKYMNMNKHTGSLWDIVSIRIRGRDHDDEAYNIDSEYIIDNKKITINSIVEVFNNNLVETNGIPHYMIFDELDRKCDCSYISEINLSDNMYSPYQLTRIINSLINKKSLSIISLNLSNNNISDKSFKLLLEFISSKSCCNLQSLNLNSILNILIII